MSLTRWPPSAGTTSTAASDCCGSTAPPRCRPARQQIPPRCSSLQSANWCARRQPRRAHSSPCSTTASPRVPPVRLSGRSPAAPTVTAGPAQAGWLRGQPLPWPFSAWEPWRTPACCPTLCRSRSARSSRQSRPSTSRPEPPWRQDRHPLRSPHAPSRRYPGPRLRSCPRSPRRCRRLARTRRRCRCRCRCRLSPYQRSDVRSPRARPSTPRRPPGRRRSGLLHPPTRLPARHPPRTALIAPAARARRPAGRPADHVSQLEAPARPDPGR